MELALGELVRLGGHTGTVLGIEEGGFVVLDCGRHTVRVLVQPAPTLKPGPAVKAVSGPPKDKAAKPAATKAAEPEG